MRKNGVKTLIGIGGVSIIAIPIVFFSSLILVFSSFFGEIKQSEIPTSCVDISRSILHQTGGAADKYFGQFAPADRAERQKIAALIIQIGKERKLSPKTIAIAVATSIQESGLRNLPHQGVRNDHDSLNMYQQRPSQGWGTPAQLLDPVYAINKFYDALTRVANRDEPSRKMVDVAIQVQGPNPFYYYRDWKWDDIAIDLVTKSSVAAPAAETIVQNSCDKSSNNTVRASDGKWHSPLDKSKYTKSSPFSMRLNPITRVFELHNGVDLSADGGTPIYSVCECTVTSTEWQSSGGNVTFIRDSEGHTFGFGHQQSRAPHIKVGVAVKPGEVIGYVGTTGGSTGTHLHFMIMTNSGGELQFIEPEKFMRERGILL